MSRVGYKNRLTGLGAWTQEGTAFSASPPLANLGTKQVPTPAAEFTGDTATFVFAAQDGAGAAESFTTDVLALMALQDIPDGATITWKDGANVVIASETWSRFKNRAANSYILLDTPVTLDTIKCTIAGAGAGLHWIGAAFAGQSWEYDQVGRWAGANQSSASITRISGTDWTFADVRRRGFPVEAFGTRGEILGVNADGTEYSGDDAETMLHEIGLYGQMILFPSTRSANDIRATAIYGVLDSVGNPEHAENGIHKVKFRVLESR